MLKQTNNYMNSSKYMVFSLSLSYLNILSSYSYVLHHAITQDYMFKLIHFLQLEFFGALLLEMIYFGDGN